MLLRTKYLHPPGILLSEIRVKQNDKYCRILLIVESKNNHRKLEAETRLVVVGGPELGEEGQRGQTSSFKICKYWDRINV